MIFSYYGQAPRSQLSRVEHSVLCSIRWWTEKKTDAPLRLPTGISRFHCMAKAQASPYIGLVQLLLGLSDRAAL